MPWTILTCAALVIAGQGKAFVAGADLKFFLRAMLAGDLDRISPARGWTAGLGLQNLFEVRVLHHPRYVEHSVLTLLNRLAA